MLPSLLRLTPAALAAAALAWALAAPAMAADPRASRYYEDALGRYERKDVAGAIIQLKNALQLDRSMLPVHVLLGKALLANGEAAAAEVSLQEALRLGVDRAELALPLMQAQIAQGKHKDALSASALSPVGLPASVQFPLLLQRASATGDLGDLKGALKLVQDARAINAASPESWIAEVPLRIRQREMREAAAAADKALALAPNSAEAWYQKGTIGHTGGDLRSALAGYDKALALDAGHAEARVARAGLLLDLGRADDAAADLAELQKRAPREPRAAYLKALLAERQGKADAAQAALREVTALLDPVPVEYIRYRPQLLLLNGLAHFGLGEREKAKPHLEAVQRAQGPSPASKLLAQIYLLEPNLAKAVEVLEPYVRLHPSDSQAVSLLAATHLALGQNARASGLLQEAMRQRDEPQLRTVLGMSLIGTGRTQDAAAQLEAAFRRDPRQTHAGLQLAMLYLRNGQAAQAQGIAETLVKLRPGEAAFQNLLGLALARNGRSAAARAAFEQALKLDPGLQPAQLNLARLDMAGRAFDAAEARLAPLLKANPRDVEAAMEMATLSSLRKQDDEAQRWLEKANEWSNAKDTRAGLTLVDRQLQRGQRDAALQTAKLLSGRAPDDLAVMVAYTRAQLAAGDAAGARTTLGNATAAAKYDPAAQVQVASLQLAAGNAAGAAYSLDKALSAQPDFLPAQALLVDVEVAQGELAKAEQRAQQIVQKYPQLAVGHNLMGDVALARGKPALALEAYRRAHRAEPSLATLRRVFQLALAQEGGKGALPPVEQWLKQHPGDLAALRLLANGRAQAGDFTGAREAYAALLRSAPNDADALNNLANIQLQQKDKQAQATAERALALDPQNANVIDTAGWAAFLAGQSDRALQLLRDARLRDPANGEIRFHLAAVLAQAGRKTEARDELETALKAPRGFESAGAARSLLASLQ